MTATERTWRNSREAHLERQSERGSRGVSAKPIAEVPVSVEALESEVAQMERLAAVLKRRGELEHDLASMGFGWQPRSLSRKEIVRLVARRRHLTVDGIASEDKRRELVEARWEAMWLMRRQRDEDGNPRWTMVQIGESLGGLDHTSVLNGLRRHEALMAAAGVAFESVVGRAG